MQACHAGAGGSTNTTAARRTRTATAPSRWSGWGKPISPGLFIRFNDGDKAGAAADVSVVRKRAGLASLAAASITAADIHNERWKELSFESDRLFYLQALKINIPNGDRGAGEIPYNSPKLIWPLPRIERELNPSLK